MSLFRRVALSVIESRTKSLAVRRIAFLFLLFPFVLSAQQDCDVFNIQGLAAENLALHDSIAQFSVDSIILQPDGSYQVHLSNGTTYTFVQGCTDPAYTEYDPSANTDDGSCGLICASPSMDGYSYGVVLIGDQCWFAENLRTTVYADGTPIPEVTDDTAWSGLSTGARCDYDNDGGNVATYGRLYNWYAATDAAGLCPTGWHVPTDDEWTALETYLGANGHSGTEGTALKSTSGWIGSGNGTDDFGFSALPGGNRFPNGFFVNAGDFGYWWSSSPSGGDAWYRALGSYGPDISRDYFNPWSGFSARCLRDVDSSENQGCTDPAYTEYDASATSDDGSCSTLASTCASPSMDGHSYGVVEIGDQCWFAENLRTTVYADGTAIPEVTDDLAWEGLSTGARCDYDNYASNVATYGRLYNWYAATDAAGLCPTGWHVPTDEEWTALEIYSGTALKSTSGWNNSGNGTDDFGFSARPGGLRYDVDGSFNSVGDYGNWWSSTPSGGGSAWVRYLYSLNPDFNQFTSNPRYGFSARCLRDAD